MSFRNIPDDLVLPPGGALVPGSGTVYIGSKRLPAAMASFESALVFYTDPIGLSQGIDFWYIAHFGASIAPFVADGLQVGYYPTGGPLTKSNMSAYYVGGTNQIIIEGNDTGAIQFRQNAGGDLIVKTNTGTVFITTQSPNVAAIRLLAPLGQNIVIGEGVNVGQPRVEFKGWNGGAANDIYIRASDSNQDIWNTDTSVQTIGTVGGCTVKFDWRITPDFVIDVRFFITCPSAPGVGAGAVGVNLPVSFPAIDLGPGTSRGGFTACVGEGGTGFYPMMMRFNNGGTCALFTNNNPNSNTIFEGGGAFTLLKP